MSVAAPVSRPSGPTDGEVDPPTSRRPGRKAGRSATTGRTARLGLMFIAPFMLVFVIFRIIPYVMALIMSFTDWSIRGDVSFVGTAQYTRLLDDPLFWNALKTTAVYAVIVVPLTVVISVGTALLVQKMIRGIRIFRALFFLPNITSFVLSGLIFVWIYSQDGPFNSALEAFGLPPIPFLQSELTVLPAIAVLMAWTRFGYQMLIVLAGLNEIPEELYEAARVDGANRWQQFTRITLPLLKPTLFFVVLIETVGSFQMFDAVYVMTGGGPVRASYTLVYMIYDQAFKSFDFGYASAVGVVLLLICLVLALVQQRLLGRES